MLTKETEAKISKILVKLSEGEKNIENSRKVLSENIDFDSYQIFRYIDKEGKNIIDSTNILDFLKKNGIYANLTEIDLLIMFYDEDNDGCLSYYELLSLIQSNTVLKRSNPSLIYQNIPLHIEKLLVKLFEKEIDLSRSILCLLTDLKTRPDFKMQNIFHSLESCGGLNYDSIKFFLDRNCIRIQKNDIYLILKRLDFNKDGCVDYCEFNKFLGYPNNNNICNFNSPKCSPCNSPNRSFNRNLHFDYLNPFPPRRKCCDRSNEYSPMRISYDDDISNFNTNNNSNFRDNNYQSFNLSPRLSLRFSPMRNNGNNRFVNNSYTIDNCDDYYNSNSNNMFYPNDNNFNTIQKYFIPPEKKQNINNNNMNQNFNNQNYNNMNYPNQNQNYNNNINQKNNFNNNFNNQNKNNINIPPQNKNFRNINSQRKKPKPPSKEELQFIDFLCQLMAAESTLEQARIDLSLKTDFTCQDAFKIFEQNNRGFLSDEDLKYGFEELGVCINDKDINLLLKRFDIENEGVINYNAFFDMLVPFEKDYRNMIENRPSNSTFSGTSDIFMMSTKEVLRDVLNLILNYENKFNEMKKKFASMRSVLKDIFMKLDRLNVGYFTNEDLISYLKRNNIFTTLKDADLLFIRFDRNRNGQVDFEEVENECQVEN